MARKRLALSVLMNGRNVGRLDRDTNGIIGFAYDQAWLDWPDAIPVSLSLPLQEGRKTGNSVADFFDNLLPDNVQIRRHLAERVGARGIDAFSLLDAVGRDCVGALQFLPEGVDPGDSTTIEGEPIGEAGIVDILRNLKRAPLGSGAETEFRISIAGAQDKTALLRRDGRWEIPRGATPTTHILKRRRRKPFPSTGRFRHNASWLLSSFRLRQPEGAPLSRPEGSSHKLPDDS